MSIYDPNCTRCELHSDAKTVCMPASVGTIDHAWIVGEAPGVNEDVSGSPFVGRAGTWLAAAMRLAGVTRAEVNITNAVKCRPPNNRTPRSEEIEMCLYYLGMELPVGAVVLTLGNAAMEAVLGFTGVTNARGKLYLREMYRCKVLPTWHPSYVMRQGAKSEVAEQFRADIQKWVSLLWAT